MKIKYFLFLFAGLISMYLLGIILRSAEAIWLVNLIGVISGGLIGALCFRYVSRQSQLLVMIGSWLIVIIVSHWLGFVGLSVMQQNTALPITGLLAGVATIIFFRAWRYY
jgi:hypothetical protein